MAFLSHFVCPSEDAPGFVLPVFRAFAGANEELVQEINQDSVVVALHPFGGGRHDAEVAAQDKLTIEVGKAAIWAFRKPDGTILVGTEQGLISQASNILGTGELEHFPLAAAELVTFSRAELKHPRVLIRAFEALKIGSVLGAEVWRDTALLLPALKEELAGRFFPRRQRGGNPLRHAHVVSGRNIIRAFVPHDYLQWCADLPRFSGIASNFGVTKFEFHPLTERRNASQAGGHSWVIYGAGGVAQHVLMRGHFRGQAQMRPLARGTIALDGSVSLEDERDERRKLVVVVCSSDPQHVQNAEAFSMNGGSYKHVINVRPIGFGTPSPKKLSPNDIQYLLVDADIIWLVGNHRQRRSSGALTNMAALNKASRITRATLVALIDLFTSRRGSEMLNSLRGRGLLGLVNSLKFNGTLPEDDQILRLLHGMLFEGAALHTASQIFILWPYPVAYGKEVRYLQMGSHRYQVHLIPQERRGRTAQITGFAVDVKIGASTWEEFQDFCVSLLAGYGWVVRNEEQGAILLENEGAVLRVWPVVSVEQIMVLLKAPSGFQPDTEIIIASCTVKEKLRELAHEKEWRLMHYSEIDSFMRRDFGIGVFSDL